MSNIQTINFNNQQLLTVEKDGIKYVAVKPICENLGLDWDSQRKRIDRNEILNSTKVIMTVVAEDGKNREMVCLPIDYINGFLFGIDTSRVSEEVRPVVLYYQKECYRVLFEFWNKPKEQEPTKPVEPAPLPGSFRDKMEAVLMSIDRLKVKGKPKEALIVSATEKVTGIKLDYHVMIERKTYSATEIGDKLGVSANKIGRIANKHNLKVSKYDEYYIDKAKGHDKQVETFRYYDEDHVIENFLEFIEKSMTNEPQLITPASESRYDYYRKLAKGEN